VPPVARRHRERQHLRHRPRVDRESTRCFAPAQALYINRSSHLPIQFHAFHPSAFNAPRFEGYLEPEFYSGAAGLSGRFTEGFSLRRLQRPNRVLQEADLRGCAHDLGQNHELSWLGPARCTLGTFRVPGPW
jgi:hypothetical protein